MDWGLAGCVGSLARGAVRSETLRRGVKVRKEPGINSLPHCTVMLVTDVLVVVGS